MKFSIGLISLLAVLLSGCGADDASNLVVGELASDRIELAAESAEPIIEILVAEGEVVTTGQILLRQDDARGRLNVAQTQAVLARVEAQLAELVRGPREERIAVARANLDGARRDHDFRRIELQRIQRIFDRELTSRESLDSAQAAFDTAEATLRARRAALDELLSGTTVEEIEQAEQSVREAKARVDQAQIDVDRLTILAPADGIVDTRLFEVGERPQPGQPVMVMLPAMQTHARVYVSEGVRVHLAPGAPAKIFVDGLERPLAGRLRWVSSDPAFTPYYALTERDRGRLSFLAKVDIVEPRDRLPDGVPVEVEFTELVAR